MPDSRFYEALTPASVGELATLAGARLANKALAGRLIDGVGALVDAGSGDMTFCADRRHGGELAATRAGACFLAEGQAANVPQDCAALVTPFPQAAYAVAVRRLIRVRGLTSGAAAVDPTAVLEDGVTISPGAVIGPGALVGCGTVIGPGAFVGPGVAIGRECVIGPRAIVVFALVGNRVSVHAGAVVGEPGFGAAAGPRGVVDIPQLGRVIIQDGVTIGANSCVDRGAFGDTVIGENSKIDNLVQIAHNVVIGRNCLLAAHTGVSGSTVIGDGCMLGGRVGIADHISIGPGARLAAASGVMKDVPAGETWGGTPARPIGRWMRETAILARMATRRQGGNEKT